VVETTPDGESVVTPSNLTAVRDEHDVNLTSEGWLISSFDSEVLEIVRGVEACPG
jgi:hypothetical protein